LSLLSIVVNYHTDELLYEFLRSYREFVDQDYRRLVVVDVEGDPARSFESRWRDMPVSNWLTDTENCGYAQAVNWAVSSQSESDFDNIAIFNADTKFIDHFIVDSCVDLLDSNDDIAVVGPMQFDSQGRITHAGIFGTNDKPFHRAWLSRDKDAHRYVADCVSVSGSAYFIKRKVWDEMFNCHLYKEIDPDSKGAMLQTPHYYEETYLSYHVREHGYRVVYNGEAEMIHEWHKSSPVDGEVDSKFMPISQSIFRKACDYHDIKHD